MGVNNRVTVKAGWKKRLRLRGDPGAARMLLVVAEWRGPGVQRDGVA